MADAALRIDRAASVEGLTPIMCRAIMYDVRETLFSVMSYLLTMHNISDVWQARGKLPAENVSALQGHVLTLADALDAAEKAAEACFTALHAEALPTTEQAAPAPTPSPQAEPAKKTKQAATAAA